MAHFTITSGDEFSGATVIFPDGSTQTIASDNKNYSEVVRGLIEGDLTDEEILDLIAPFEAIYKKLTRLSERVSRKGMRLFFDGDLVTHRLANHIVTIMDGGSPQEEVTAWLRFWEKAATNPSTKSQDELFIFVEKHGLSITPDGDAVLYKGVRNDFTSSHAGPGIVDGVEYEKANLPNKVGSVLELPRSWVDDNRRIECSKGLHVGDFTYASTFASKLLTVLVNPRDVVSVPYDENDRKIRVCRYTVIEETPDRKPYTDTIISFDAKEDDDTPTTVLVSVDPAAPEDVPVIVKVDTSTKKVVYPEGSRIPEYKNLIEALIKLDPNTNLKRYKSKKITAGRRAEFEAAASELGYKL